MKKYHWMLLVIDVGLAIVCLCLFYGNVAEEKPVLSENVVQEDKKIALTFDDGPNPEYTPKLLDGLKERNVKCTFFLLGKNAEVYPDIVKRISKEGHLIGNHTYSHVQLTTLSDEMAKKELDMTDKVICDITGKNVEYVRPPFGDWNKKSTMMDSYIIVLWNVDSRDWVLKNRECIVRNTLASVKDGSIILMHDSYQTSVDAALDIIDSLKREGYEFVTVDELVMD